jgi:hypothetical protein
LPPFVAFIERQSKANSAAVATLFRSYLDVKDSKTKRPLNYRHCRKLQAEIAGSALLLPV